MAEIGTILFASDLTPEADHAFEHARFLAERFGSRVTLFHALEMPRERDAAWTDLREDYRGRLAAKARQELCARGRALTVPYEVVVDEAHVGGHALADLSILDMIQKTRPDLTVMATHSRKGFASWFLGSVAHQVVQHAGRPVLCVRKSPHGGMPPYRRILVPTDLSEASRRAFPLAGLLARSCEATVSALHVLTPPPLSVLAGASSRSVPPPTTEPYLRRFLGDEFDDVRVERTIYATGAPWWRIVQSAEAERADLIVMSTQGHDSVKDGIIGSTTDRVLRHAPCPVLVA